jgi:hypothetical protein
MNDVNSAEFQSVLDADLNRAMLEAGRVLKRKKSYPL